MRRASLGGVLGSALLAGCAALVPGLGEGPRSPAFRQSGLTVPAAAEALAVGRSTKAEVAALLGDGEAVRFGSGYEVWVYRARGARAPSQAAELAVLFSPDGVVTKVRARPASGPGP